MNHMLANIESWGYHADTDPLSRRLTAPRSRYVGNLMSRPTTPADSGVGVRAAKRAHWTAARRAIAPSAAPRRRRARPRAAQASDGPSPAGSPTLRHTSPASWSATGSPTLRHTNPASWSAPGSPRLASPSKRLRDEMGRDGSDDKLSKPEPKSLCQ